MPEITKPIPTLRSVVSCSVFVKNAIKKKKPVMPIMHAKMWRSATPMKSGDGESIEWGGEGIRVEIDSYLLALVASSG
jgi:hypothetical protein